MKRLTEKRDGKNVIPLRQDGKTKWLLASAGLGEPSTHFLYGEYADKLANYENTGLTPEQIIEMDKLYAEKCKELAEYKRLEEKGLLLKLPCEIGTRVYQIYRFLDEGAWEIDEHTIKLEDLELIGKTIFLTQAEAEEALKKMKGE